MSKFFNDKDVPRLRMGQDLVTKCASTWTGSLSSLRLSCVFRWSSRRCLRAVSSVPPAVRSLLLWSSLGGLPVVSQWSLGLLVRCCGPESLPEPFAFAETFSPRGRGLSE